jgi:multiple sugar transport system permease protein
LPYLVLVAQSLQEARVPQATTLQMPNLRYLSNYVEVMQLYPLWEPIANSLLVAAIAVPITLLTASLAGFALSQLNHGQWRRWIVLTSALLMLVPIPALWIPRFVYYLALGLLNQLPALALPAIAGSSPFFALIFYWTFKRIPQSIFEAARLDGAGALQIWWRLGLPLARPALAVVSVLCFTLYWNDYMSPLILIRDIPKHPIALRMQLLQGGDVTLIPLQMAGIVIAILPVVILFFLVQRYFWPEGRKRFTAQLDD